MSSAREMKSSPQYQNPAIHLVTMRMHGHAGPSGYDRIIDYINATVIAPSSQLTILSKIIAKLLRRQIANSGVRWYHREEFICEMNAARRWLSSNGALFHFIYGENSFRYMPVVKKFFPKNKIICTFHTPAERFESLVTDKRYLQSIDAAVVVSTSQIPYFSKIIGDDKVYFIPHGIDIDIFKPGSDKEHLNDRFNCIFVGKHLRDVATMREIASKSEKHCPGAHFHIVSDEATVSLFTNRSNVSTYHNVPDEKLISLYRSADALTLPLLESTANNSILEAIACGLPVITTDLIGTRDYLNSDCAVFIPPKEPDAFVDQIKFLMNHPDKCAQMAKASRNKAMELSWQAIAVQLEDLYRKI